MAELRSDVRVARGQALAGASERHSIRIVIADDQRLFREALRHLLETDAALQVVGEAGDGPEAIRLVHDRRPDILLLNLRMPSGTGLTALRELSLASSPVLTLVLAAELDGADLIEALQLGARGVLTKQSATELLFKSIHTVMAGEYWVGRNCVGELVAHLSQRPATLASPAAPGRFGLTPRELDIVATIGEGCTNEDIAHKFSISVKTVKHHLTKIFNKVGVSNRLELAVFAVHHHLESAA